MKTRNIIIAVLIALMVVSVASAAVLYEYNNTATATMNLEKPNSQDVETLVSDDGINYSESITLDGVSAGDSVVLFFSHENVGDSDFMFGTVEYEITCDEGLEFKGPCKGSIHDFMDSEPGISIMPMPKPADKCHFYECGIIHMNTWGISYPVNGPEYVNMVSDNAASITPWDYGVFEDIEYSQITVTFVTDEHGSPYGTYTVSGTVNTIDLYEIPIVERELINETIEA